MTYDLCSIYCDTYSLLLTITVGLYTMYQFFLLYFLYFQMIDKHIDCVLHKNKNEILSGAMWFYLN